MAAGLELFAEHGFRTVTVGQIEEAVGLVPRRGAMYRHFPSKAALLEAAVEGRLEAIARVRQGFENPDGPPDMAEFAAFVLAEMDRQRYLTRILEKDGDRLGALRDRFRTGISDAGYQAMHQLLLAWAAAAGESERDEDWPALAVLLLGALVNVQRSTMTLGGPPLGMAEERLISAWAALCRQVVGPA